MSQNEDTNGTQIDTAVTPRVVDTYQPDDLYDIDTAPGRESFVVDKTVQTWVSECSTNDIMSSFFMTCEGVWIQQYLYDTDIIVQNAAPSLHQHSRLTLSLNERALKRMIYILRLYKARRRSKILYDPLYCLRWQAYALKESFDKRNHDGLGEQHIDREENPLDVEEVRAALTVHSGMKELNCRGPVIVSCPHILHFKVVTNDLTKAVVFESVDKSTYASDRGRTYIENLFNIINQILADAASRQDTNDNLSQITQATPFTRTPQSYFGESADSGIIPMGTVITLEYRAVQELVHEGFLAVYR